MAKYSSRISILPIGARSSRYSQIPRRPHNETTKSPSIDNLGLYSVSQRISTTTLSHPSKEKQTLLKPYQQFFYYLQAPLVKVNHYAKKRKKRKNTLLQ